MIISYEYLLISIGIVLCFVVAFVLDRKQDKKFKRTEWKDLNKMMADLYKDNEILKNNIFEAGNKQRLLDAVLDQVKLSSETMFHANQSLIDNYKALTRKCDGLEQEIVHLKNEIPKNPDLTPQQIEDWASDPLDDWQHEEGSLDQLDLFQPEDDESF